ncbi:hypothetical protein NT6N_26980 [Oceaniferula spumae]|uniref:NADP-dependent oxidoreductase domain-containing protein n=1 Tax=Oceaniferula spumae TaxID=2979115 RepID=A0AAT9FNV3_9BACT
MRKVTLSPGVESSVLGFGCAPILGAVGGKDADQALRCALDNGITHFDVARSYGYGEAEKFLGKFFREQREQVVIASKFGIRATWKAGLLRPLKPLARAMGRGKKSGCAPVQEEAIEKVKPRRDPFHERVAITPENMQTSLERSLRALKTDYLDLLFIHEPTGAIENVEAMVAAADRLKAEGKIRGFGLAFDWATHEIFLPDFERFDVLQFNNSPSAGHYDLAHQLRQDKTNVFFSPLKNRGELTPSQTLSKLWSDFPNSVVLCSMFNPEHIKANVQSARV